MNPSERMSIQAISGLFKLDGRVALVTGGAGSLGGALARGFAIHGADVAIVDLLSAGAGPLLKEIQALDRRAVATTADVTDEGAVEHVVEEVVESLGRIDIVATAAGAASRIPMEDMPVEEWQRIQDVNVRGTYLCCQKAGKWMIENRSHGKMITIGSVRGFQGNPGGYSAYTTSKGAVHALTKQMATEWAKHNINVNCIAPAIFWTPLTQQVLDDKRQYDFHMARIPLGRAGTPDDFIGAAVFLASAASDFMTGAVVNVDGGWLAS